MNGANRGQSHTGSHCPDLTTVKNVQCAETRLSWVCHRAVFWPLIAVSANFALQAGVLFRLARLAVVSASIGRVQAKTHLSALFRFPEPLPSAGIPMAASPAPSQQAASTMRDTAQTATTLHREWVLVGGEKKDGDGPFDFRAKLGRFYDLEARDLMPYDDFGPQQRLARSADQYGAFRTAPFAGLKSASTPWSIRPALWSPATSPPRLWSLRPDSKRRTARSRRSARGRH
jgi:hypothetical protein